MIIVEQSVVSFLDLEACKHNNHVFIVFLLYFSSTPTL